MASSDHLPMDPFYVGLQRPAYVSLMRGHG
jgi:hypothetical protein